MPVLTVVVVPLDHVRVCTPFTPGVLVLTTVAPAFVPAGVAAAGVAAAGIAPAPVVLAADDVVCVFTPVELVIVVEGLRPAAISA